MAELNPEIQTPDVGFDSGYTFGGIPLDDSMAQLLAQQKQEAQKQIATQTLSAMIANRKQAGVFIASKI